MRFEWSCVDYPEWRFRRDLVVFRAEDEATNLPNALPVDIGNMCYHREITGVENTTQRLLPIVDNVIVA